MITSPRDRRARALQASAAALLCLCALALNVVAASAATRAVATGGADSGDCIARPCKGFAYAYRQAVAGDVVEVAAGSYPEQSIPDIAGRSLPGVEFRPAAGASVQLNGVRVSGDAVTLRAMQTGYVDVDTTSGTADDVTIDGGSGPGMYIGNARNLLVRGGSYGSVVETPIITIGGGSGITFDGVDFHDATAPAGSAAHLECIYAASPQGFTVRNSIFRNCAYFDIFFTKLGGPDPKDVLLENNVFERTFTQGGGNAPYAVNVSNWLSKMENFTFRNNTFGSAIAIQPTSVVNSRFTGNIGPSRPCVSGATFSHNVWADGTCSGTDKRVASIMSQFVAPAAHDWHLVAGSGAIGAADPADAPTLDRDGFLRDAAPDAGAQEFGAGPPPEPCGCTPPPTPPPAGGTSGGGGKSSSAAAASPAAGAAATTDVPAASALAGVKLPGKVAPLRRLRISSVSICRRRQGACPGTARIRVLVSSPADLTLRVRRFGANGRLRTQRTLHRRARVGESLLRIRGAGLAPGRYRVVLTATRKGARRATVTLPLRVR